MSGAGDRNRSRMGRRVVAVVLAFVTFTAIIVRPAPVRADTKEVLIYAGIGLGVYLAVITIATLAIYRADVPDTSAVPVDSLKRDDVHSFPVQAGTHCVHRDGQVTLFCW